MRASEELRSTLSRIDGKGYKAYKDLSGYYDFGRFSLSVDHVQGDPFAAPSRLSVQISFGEACFPADLHSGKVRKVAFGDFLGRAFGNAIKRYARQRRGSGHSGRFQVDCGGQEVLERNSIVLGDDWIEARFTAGLPAAGRRVLAQQASAMFFDELPRIVENSLRFENCASAELRRHVETIEDQEYLRNQLRGAQLVSFIGNGSILPRRSGVDDRPLREKNGEVVIPFQSPDDLEVVLECPNQGKVKGMGIPGGVTLIVGGGYHGKSTLLRAIERGIYNHIPGDGREWTVSDPSAVKIRAEDGRSVQNVDISPFIADLPYGRKTVTFATDNASGSTSQAANIIEALEVETKLLLIDEDTSATNFIIRDARMQALVEKSREPITPFLDRVRQLLREHGISTVMVMGGAGDYFEVSDHVVMMDQYRARSVTRQARQIVKDFPSRRISEREDPFGGLGRRYPVAESFDSRRGKRDVKVDVNGLGRVVFGTTSLDLTALEQIVDPSQTRAIVQAMLILKGKFAAEKVSLLEGLKWLESALEREGLDILSVHKAGNLAFARIQEIAFAINRLRTLKVQGTGN